MVTIAVAPTYEKGRLYTLPLANLQADPQQPRKSMDPQTMEELAASIARHGILEPLLFRVRENGTLTIVAEERRVRAARQAGLDTVPGILVDGNHAEIALVENLLRQDLTVVEEAEALQSFMTDRSCIQEQKAAFTEALNELEAAIEDLLPPRTSTEIHFRLDLASRPHTPGNRPQDRL